MRQWRGGRGGDISGKNVEFGRSRDRRFVGKMEVVVLLLSSHRSEATSSGDAAIYKIL